MIEYQANNIWYKIIKLTRICSNDHPYKVSDATGKQPGGNHANASKIVAFTLSKRVSAAAFPGSAPKRPPGTIRASRVSKHKVIRFKSPGIVNRKSERKRRSDTIEDKRASRQITSCGTPKYLVPSTIHLVVLVQHFPMRSTYCSIAGPLERAAERMEYPARTHVQAAPGLIYRRIKFMRKSSHPKLAFYSYLTMVIFSST